MTIKILLVDDDDGFRLAIKKALELENYLSIEAKDGVEALRILAKENIDLLITDVWMPKMNGMELSIKIKERYPKLNILGVSGGRRGDEASIEKMSKSFFTLFLSKPFSTEKLIKNISILLE